MTYRQLQQLLDDPNTDQNFVGEVWDTVLGLDEDELDNELKSADASCVRQMACAYRVALPKSDADLEAEAKAKAAAEKSKAEAEAKAEAEEARYQAGLEAIKADHELWDAYNNASPEIRKKIDNGARFQGANVVASKAYYLGLIKK